MATPSRPNPGATPTHLTSSPHPAAVPMGRGLSHKSPSIRTPSASGTHGHHPSTSSYQGATPLTATAGLDDPVALSSPSALLALGGFTGMSPALNVQDSLVGSGMNDSDLRALTLGLGGSRNHEEERRKRIEEVVELLRTRVAGRGVSREAVERLGRLEGFESIWQEDSLSIAGNSVDLEIEFYPGEDNVKDVSLSYASLEGEGEGERRDEATAVLKGDLIQTPEEREERAWKKLKGFQGNLERLAKLDKLSQEVNCFEAVESLFECLQKVWETENQRGIYRGTYDHLCRGSIGRPSLHKRGRVGMGLEYWVENHRLLHAKQTKKSDAMAIDSEDNGDDKLRSVTIECEEGFPSLRISKDWVGPEILTSIESNENSPEAVVNWSEPPPTLQSSTSLDPGMGPGTPNRRFVAKLEPHVHVPLLIASEIYRHLGLTLPQDYRTTTYDDLLVPGWTNSSGDSDDSMSSESLETPERRRKKAVLSFNDDEPVQKTHSYSFQAFDAAPGRIIRDFPFSHPRQLADIFPVCISLVFYPGLANGYRYSDSTAFWKH
jgi:Mediator of RNA polymerase II transcription subunit 1